MNRLDEEIACETSASLQNILALYLGSHGAKLEALIEDVKDKFPATLVQSMRKIVRIGEAVEGGGNVRLEAAFLQLALDVENDVELVARLLGWRIRPDVEPVRLRFDGLYTYKVMDDPEHDWFYCLRFFENGTTIKAKCSAVGQDFEEFGVHLRGAQAGTYEIAGPSLQIAVRAGDRTEAYRGMADRRKDSKADKGGDFHLLMTHATHPIAKLDIDGRKGEYRNLTKTRWDFDRVDFTD